MEKILPNTKIREKTNVFTVFSPDSNEKALRFAEKKALELSETGRTLLIQWDPFSTGTTSDTENCFSRFLFAFKNNRNEIGRILEEIPLCNGVYRLYGVDFYSDLWNFSEPEMEELCNVLRQNGGYTYVVFECGFLSGSVEKLMKMCDCVWIVGGNTQESVKNFIRQMKYGGRHEIVTKIQDGE